MVLITLSASILIAADDPIHLGRIPVNECAGVELTCKECDPFPASRFVAREDATFIAVIGPAANPRGYTAITSECINNSCSPHLFNKNIPALLVEYNKYCTKSY